MLEQFFKDWNTAIQSRTVVKESKNPKGIITFQQTKFRFRDKDITMYSNIVSNTENAAPDRRRWMSELFVPATNKIIPGTPFPTRTKCAIAILMALTEGRDHEDKVEARNQARRQREIKKLQQDRIKKLSVTSFTDDEKKLIIDYLYSREEIAVYADLIINVLCKYHNYITGRGLIECGINLGSEAASHINRMYGTVAMLISESLVNKYNVQTLKYMTMSRLFLAPKDNLTTGIYTVRSGLSKMFDDMKTAAKFMHLINLLAAYYERVSGVALADKIEQEKARIQKIREQRIAGVPVHKKGAPWNNVRVFSSNTAPVGSTIGDIFGDVLDNVKTNTPEDKPVKKQKINKKSKIKNAVTDGQINGKLMEQPKQEAPAETPAEAKEETKVDEVPAEKATEAPVSEAPATETASQPDNPVLGQDFELPPSEEAAKKPAKKRTRKTTKKAAEAEA